MRMFFNSNLKGVRYFFLVILPAQFVLHLPTFATVSSLPIKNPRVYPGTQEILHNKHYEQRQKYYKC